MAQHGDMIQATISIRDNLPGKSVRPEAIAMNGKTIRASYGFTMGEGDRYPGEVAWIIDREDDAGRITWIAEGDLTDIREMV